MPLLRKSFRRWKDNLELRLRQNASLSIFPKMIGYPSRPRDILTIVFGSNLSKSVRISATLTYLLLASHMDVTISVFIDRIIGHALKRSTLGIACGSHVPGLHIGNAWRVKVYCGRPLFSLAPTVPIFQAVLQKAVFSSSRSRGCHASIFTALEDGLRVLLSKLEHGARTF